MRIQIELDYSPSTFSAVELISYLKNIEAGKVIEINILNTDKTIKVDDPESTLKVKIRLHTIQRKIAEKYNISDFNVKSRKREIIQPRQLSMTLCKKMCPSLSLSEIGNLHGGMDHATVLHAIKVIRNYCETDKKTFDQFDAIAKEITGHRITYFI